MTDPLTLIIIIASFAVITRLIFGAIEFLQDWRKCSKAKLMRTAMRGAWIPKPWGGEEVWIDSPYYASKILFINKGHRLSKQYHKHKAETIRILAGHMVLHLEWKDEKFSIAMYPGDVYHIHQGLIHRMDAIEDTQVLETSTPHLDDVIRLEDDYGR